MAGEMTDQDKLELEAFNKAIGLEENAPAGDQPQGEATEEPVTEEPAATEEAAAEEAAAAAEEPTAAGEDPPAEPAATETPAAEEPAAAPPAESTDEIKALRERLEMLEKEKATPPAATPPTAEEPAAPPPEEELKDYEFSEDEQKALAYVKEEFPDIEKAFAAVRAQAEHNARVGYQREMRIFAEQLKNYLAPLVSTHIQSAEEKHLAAIRSAVSDYDEVVGLLPEWVGKKPGILGQTYKKAMEEGTVEEVVELIRAFKQDTGRVQPQEQNPNPQAALAAPAAPQTHAAPPADKVKALTAVKSGGRTTPKPAAGSKELTEEEAFNLAIGAK